jgi:hypothetical protein
MQPMKYLLIPLFAASGICLRTQPKRLDPKRYILLVCPKTKGRGAHRPDSLHFRYWMENQAVDI